MIENYRAIKKNKYIYIQHMDEAQKHDEWKKQDTEDFIRYNSINVKYTNRQKQSTLFAVRIFASGG